MKDKGYSWLTEIAGWHYIRCLSSVDDRCHAPLDRISLFEAGIEHRYRHQDIHHRIHHGHLVHHRGRVRLLPFLSTIAWSMLNAFQLDQVFPLGFLPPPSASQVISVHPLCDGWLRGRFLRCNGAGW